MGSTIEWFNQDGPTGRSYIHSDTQHTLQLINQNSYNYNLNMRDPVPCEKNKSVPEDSAQV